MDIILDYAGKRVCGYVCVCVCKCAYVCVCVCTVIINQRLRRRTRAWVVRRGAGKITSRII